MVVLALLCLSILSVGYTLFLFVHGSRRVDGDASAPDGLTFVVMIPCLDEELVIGRSVERLLDIDDPRLRVLVIDDGSTDRTAEIVQSFDSDRIELFRRTAPDCRQGKGEALNAAYRHVRDRTLEQDADPSQLVLGVLDADGRLDPEAIDKVAPHFSRPDLGAVQIKVRIHNAPDAVVARLQDFEFATFTEVFQRARARLGCSGLGGNGQFTRLSALMDLGDSPWTDCLTEDLELGINLLLSGHSNAFDADAWVSQQGVTSIRPLIRQRTRWFQGHLQCLQLVRPILRSGLRPIARFDLCFHLVNSVLMLLVQTLSVVFLATIVTWSIVSPSEAFDMLGAGLTPALLYLVAFGLAPLAVLSYARTEREISVWRAMVLGHLYILYTYLWWFAGCRALGRHIRGSRSWAKTARTVGTGDEEPVSIAPATSGSSLAA